jgi:putative hydrolase of the HAD superfamily
MTAKISTIFFDLGYTLINFNGNVSRVLYRSYLALAESLIRSGYRLKRRPFANLYRQIINRYYEQREIDHIEQPVSLFVNRTLAAFGFPPASPEISRQAIAAMFKVTEAHWRLEKDTHAALTALKNQYYHMCIISNASNTEDLNNLVDGADLRKYFDHIIISSDTGIRKPDGRIYEIALNTMHANPAESVMVGDTLGADILGAQLSGLRAVWITHRAKRPDNTRLRKAVKPDAEISRLSQLPEVIERLQK